MNCRSGIFLSVHLVLLLIFLCQWINAAPTTMSISNDIEVMKSTDSTMGVKHTEYTTQETVLSSQKSKQAAAGRTTSDSDSSSNSSAFSGGVIAGVVVSVIGGIFLCCCCLFFLGKMCS